MKPISELIKKVDEIAKAKGNTNLHAITPRERPSEVPDISDYELTKRHVNMSNALARSAQRLNLEQKRIIALALAKTDSVKRQHLYVGSRIGWTISLSAANYADTYEVTKTQAYNQLKKGTDTLLQAIWETIEVRRHGNVITKGQWVCYARYYEGQGRIEITFHPMIVPDLLGLSHDFTSYRLKQTTALRSIYAWRLFECLMSWKETGQWNVTVEKFNQVMETPKAYLKNFGQVKKSIIDRAIKELRAKNGMIIEYKLNKAGTKVESIEFRFSWEAQKPLELEVQA